MVSLVAIVWRLIMKWRSPSYDGAYPESLSLFKDLAYGLLDVWSKGVLAMWTAYTVFNVVLFNNAPATPHVWAR